LLCSPPGPPSPPNPLTPCFEAARYCKLPAAHSNNIDNDTKGLTYSTASDGQSESYVLYTGESANK